MFIFIPRRYSPIFLYVNDRPQPVVVTLIFIGLLLRKIHCLEKGVQQSEEAD